jgi:hypothetical protein
MDVTAALKDIDAVLKIAPDQSKGEAVIIQAANRYHACIARYAPPQSTWIVQANRYISMRVYATNNDPGQDDALYGVLRALRDDVANGGLRRFEELIHANVYGDLLAQGEGLHRDGYSRAAAVVAGAALEEHIRKLAVKHGTGSEYTSGTKAGAAKTASLMNSELKAAGVYGEPQRAIVEGWQKVRNEAAHGEAGFDGADRTLVANVQPMIDGIRAFIAQYPA